MPPQALGAQDNCCSSLYHTRMSVQILQTSTRSSAVATFVASIVAGVLSFQCQSSREKKGKGLGQHRNTLSCHNPFHRSPRSSLSRVGRHSLCPRDRTTSSRLPVTNLSNCSPRTLLRGLLLPGALGAGPVTLNIQEAGMPIGNVPIGNVYNGGGGPAVNYGTTISDNAL